MRCSLRRAALSSSCKSIVAAKGHRHGIDHFQSSEPLREGLAQPPRAGIRSRDIGCQRNGRPCPVSRSCNVPSDFYQKMFGLTVVSQDQPAGIVRLGNAKVLVSLNHGSPAGIIDHFSIGIPGFSRESATRYLTQRGATPLQGDYAGLHIKDPDGVNVQISQRA